jgi:hypothetical protein
MHKETNRLTCGEVFAEKAVKNQKKKTFKQLPKVETAFLREMK